MILEVLVRVGLVCHVKDHQVCVPVGERWKRRKASQPGAVQDMVLAKDLVAEGWTKESPWHDAGYDTAWVPADCSACVFIGGAGWAAGIREETCVFDASRVTVQRWALWGTERADLSSMEWMWWEDEDRVSAHAGADGRWVPYSRETCIRIESHYLARSEGGKDKIQVMINNGHKLFHEHTGYVYEIDLVAMTQTNVMTGFERRLLRRDRLQEERAVVVLQCCVRCFVARRVARWQSSNVKAESSVANRRRCAAMMVQRCWRRCGLNTKKPIRLIDEEQEIETGELGEEPTDGEIGRGGVTRWCWGELGCGLCRRMCMVGRQGLAIVDLRCAGCVRRAADDACVLQTMFTSCTMGLQGTRQQR